jgi:hypothetical protein
MFRFHFVNSSLRNRLPWFKNKLFSTFLKPSSGYQKHSSASLKLGGWLWSIPAVTALLGTWQVYRLFWKLDLIESFEKRLKADPVGIPQK